MSTSTKIANALTLIMCLTLFAQDVFPAANCSATSSSGAGCTVNCDQGYEAVCIGGRRRAKCYCTSDEIVSDIAVSGVATSSTNLKFEVYDISCDVLPCDPSLMYTLEVSVSVDDPASELVQSVVDSLSAILDPGCSVSLVTEPVPAIRMICDSYRPKFRICEGVGNCPDIFEPGTGTDPDISVDLAGFHFQALEAIEEPIPSTNTWGLIFLSCMLAASAAWLIYRRRRVVTGD